MITRGDIVAALETYWEEKDGGHPVNHGAVRALLDKAEMADAAREQALATATLPTSTDLLDQVVAAIHRAVCDAENQSCVDAERLDAAGRAVLDMLGDMRLARFERALRQARGQVPYRPTPPAPRGQMSGRITSPGFDVEQMTRIMAAFGELAREVGPAVGAAMAEFSRKINDIQADLDRTKVRIAFADQAPDIRRVAFDRDGVEWRKIDESRWASLEHLGRYLTLADLEASLGPLADNPPPVKS